MSVLRYIAATCGDAIQTAAYIEQILVGLPKERDWKLNEDWLKTRASFEQVLTNCFYMNIVKDNAGNVLRCEIKSNEFVVVDN